ncbi:MAG: DUF616 domain-containing protein [Alphaproteobacteria bacterium]|nr:DUF616 domain-containing protein [Alphaproteobacteria bacterium]
MLHKEKSDLELIRESKYFDAAYYYAARPDVLKANVDAAWHYLNNGWKEGANPARNFNTNLYLAWNGDKEICPLVDYIRNGCIGDYSGHGAAECNIRRYWRMQRLRRAKTVCYTYVSRGYDDLISHNHIVPDWDYVCFTDDPALIKRKRVGIWRIRRALFNDLDSKRNSGWHKTHPEKCCHEYGQSVWLDANVNVLTDYLESQISKCDTELLVPIHYARDCIFEEVQAVIDAGRDTVQACLGAAHFLQSNNMPSHYGLNETNIVFRRHNTDLVRAIDAIWWDCIEKYSKRDQLSFSYALYKNGVLPNNIALNNTRTDHKNFLIFNHTEGKHMKMYDIIYSIGRDCACSFYLQTNNLRSCSGPFDWIITADFKQRFDMLLSRFKYFMNPKYFEFLPKNPNIFNDDKCDYYRNIKTGFDFYHDFPVGVPLQNHFLRSRISIIVVSGGFIKI